MPSKMAAEKSWSPAARTFRPQIDWKIRVKRQFQRTYFFKKKYLMRVEDTAMFLSDAESSKEEDAGAYLFN